MPRTEPKVDAISRETAISRLRTELLRMAGDESICKVSADRGVFCNGFCRFTDDELRDRYSWIIDRRPAISRPELEKIANDWQLAQQEVHDLPLACDVQTKVHDTCRGWHDFTNEQLAKFYEQLTGTRVTVA